MKRYIKPGYEFVRLNSEEVFASASLPVNDRNDGGFGFGKYPGHTIWLPFTPRLRVGNDRR
ncbi:MAG: hypothetical protein LBT32_01580 [Peptococcaceae bacterium]|jgi:hypothetical protein|nr:hypothetical protein [Peptococcaceae bacterium]